MKTDGALLGSPERGPSLWVDGLFSRTGRAASGLILLLSVLVPPALVHGGPIICIFRRWTDLNCPGCGLTRAFVHMGHLQWHRAFDEHLFGPFLFAILMACALLALIPPPQRRRVAVYQLRSMWAAVEPALLAAWLLWALLRLLRLSA